MKAVVTLVPMIYRTEDWMSLSVSLLMWPLWTVIIDGGTLFVPDLEGFAADAVEDGEETGLVGVFEHGWSRMGKFLKLIKIIDY